MPEIMERASRGRTTPRGRIAPIVAVGSGKGGVGKTWLSISLAHAFAAAGKRVLLVDGDLGLANIDVQLGLNPESDLSAVMAGWIELDDAVSKVANGAGAGGFDVLPGRSGSAALAELPMEETARLAAGIAALSLRYDHVLIDLGAGIEPNVMRLARAADRVVAVVNDEPTSLADCYAFIKQFRLYRPDSTPWAAVNMADNRASGRRTHEALSKACQSFLGFRPPLAGIVNRDPLVRDAIRAQVPLSIRHPRAPAWMDVKAMADALLEGVSMPDDR